MGDSKHLKTRPIVNHSLSVFTSLAMNVPELHYRVRTPASTGFRGADHASPDPAFAQLLQLILADRFSEAIDEPDDRNEEPGDSVVHHMHILGHDGAAALFFQRYALNDLDVSVNTFTGTVPMLKFQHAPFFKPRDLRPALQLLAAHLIPGMEVLAELEGSPRLHVDDLVVPLDE